MTPTISDKEYIKMLVDTNQKLVEENEALKKRIEQLSEPDMWWAESSPEYPVDTPEGDDVWYDLIDGDTVVYLCAKNLPRRTFKRVDTNTDTDDFEVVEVPRSNQ